MQSETTTAVITHVPPATKKRGNSLGVFLALILALGAFFSGFQFNSFAQQHAQTASLLTFFASTPATASSTSADMAEFWQVWQLLNEKFATASGTPKLTDEQKIQGAIKGLVASYGDPYTTYFPPSDAASFGEQISGNFSGVGMEVGIHDDIITIIAPLPGTPADKAGLLAGDAIVSIDGTSTQNMTIEDAVSHIRGPEGTTVTLKVFHKGMTEPKEVKVVRAQIEIPTVKTEKRGDTFIIALYSFNALAETKTQEALNEYIKSGAKKLVFDLRGNPGGYLQSAVAIGSYFLPAGQVIVRESYADGRPEDVFRSQGHTVKQFAPDETVVLIDKGSASAAEILAGALSQHSYATLIGTDSFGKGSVQELVDLPNKDSVKITIARWLTPDGTSISHAGLKPKIFVDRTPEEHLSGKDPQMDAAIAYLHGTYVAPVATSSATSSKP
jgi:carboxyl-terminal processing protease